MTICRFKSTLLRVLALSLLVMSHLPLCAQNASDYFTVVFFGDPEVNLTTREGNNATQANLTRWAEGIVNMHQNTNGYFNFENQPEGFVPKADLVICMGDMDGDSETSGTAIKAVFKKFTDAGIPFITMIGNHDVVPDYYNGGDVGPTTYGGHKANTFAFNLVTSYLNTAKSNGIENVKRFESENGANQAKPFTFTFRGVRFYIGQTYWFQKTYDNNTPLFGSGTPPTTYIPYDVVDELDAFVQANASTPSVWVQHYPINAADRWWNDCNENGRCITPANEDANMKTAAQKRERYKQIIAKSTNPWHFSGHQHSAYKSNYTTGGKSFTDHVAPYFATNGSAYIALCKRGEGVLEVRQVCFDENFQTPTVSNLGQFSNDKAYTITCANGFLYYNTSVTNAASGVATGLSSSNPNHQWAVVTQNGLNYLYSIGAGKFARKPSNSTNSNGTVLELVDTPDANCIVTLEWNNTDHDHPWLIKFGGVIFNVSPGETATNGVLMGGWTTIDGGNRFAISEAGDFEGIEDVKDALAEAGLDNLVTAGNLTTGWYQLWSDVTTMVPDKKLITKVSQIYSPVSAPGNEGVLSYLIDDKTDTYWHSNWAGGNLTFGSDPQMQHYVQFDLRGAYQDLTFAYCCRADGGYDRPTAFAVTASNDANGTFTQVATISNVGTTANQMQYFRLQLGAEYRYIRLRATDTHNGKRGYWHAAEMQFYPGEAKQKLITLASQMSSPKSDTHSNGSEGQLSSLIDNKPNTYWHSDWSNSVTFGSEAQLQHYVQFDLGSAYQDLTLCYRCRDAANDKPTSFAVTASNSADGTFTQVATITGVTTDPVDVQYLHFDMGAQYRYIRLRATDVNGTSKRGYWHAAEMQFYPGAFRTERVQGYYKTLNISDAALIEGNLHDIASAANNTDPNTWFYIERVGNGQIKVHLPTGYSVGTNSSRTDEATGNVITVEASNSDPSLLQLKNDANHGNRYWVSRSDVAYSGGLIVKANSVPGSWKLLSLGEKVMDYDVWTIVPKVSGNSVPTVHYTAEGYTGVSEFTTGGMLIVPKGTVLSVEDFTVDEEGSTVRIDDGNKQIVVVSKVYRLGERITNPNQIRNGGKYMILNAASKTGNGFFCKWVKNNNGNFALESNGTPAALQLAPLDAEVYADKIWTFTTVSGGYSISNTANGTKTQTISISDFAAAASKGGINTGITNQRLYFEDMGDGSRCYTTCQTGDGFWLIRNGTSGSEYWNGSGSADYTTWSNGYPYVIFQVEEVTSFDVNYGVSVNAKGFMSRSDKRRTEWVSLKVGDGEPVKIENLQQKADANNEYRPIYFNRTGVKFVCQTGAQLTAAVGVGDMNSMHTYFFIDEDGDGFEDGINAVDNSQHKVLPGHDLKTHSGYLYGGSSWYDSKGTSTNNSNLTMPAFTAPTKPGIYRVRYFVAWSSVDPAGDTNIHTNGGIIVDATLEVQAADVYNLTLDDAASIRTNVLGQRGLGYPRVESDAYAKLDAALSAIEHRNEKSALIHIENNQQLSKLGNGSRIALTCRDNQGGPGYYFNGAAQKTAPASFSADNNIFVMEESTNGYKLKRAGNGQYVAHGNGWDGTVTQSTNASDATEFTLAFAKANWDTNKMTGTDEYMAVRLTAYGSSGKFLNTQQSGSTPKYTNGTGGYSVWYLYEQPSDEQLLSNLKTALTEYYRCTDVELPVGGKNYTVTPVEEGDVQNFLLVANDDEEGTVRMVGTNVKYYNGSAFSIGYSPLDNNLKIAKCGYDASRFGCLKAGDNEIATRWTEIESPSVVEPTYQVNNNGTILMTMPGINSSVVAVYANDVEVTSEATITAGANTTVLLPSKPNRTWFTVLVADPSGVRRFLYQVLNFQRVNIEFINDVTGGSETFTNKRVSIGSTMAELLAELHPKCVVTESNHEEIEDGVLTGYVVHYEPYYPVEGLDNNSHAERYTESVSLAVGTAPAVTIATGQTTASPIYIDKRSETFVCAKGQALQPAVNFHGNAMHAYVYVDTNHDGFLTSVNDIENNVLKTGNDIDLRTFSYYNGYNSTGATQAAGVGVGMPAFTAPTVPGTYVMRYKVDWDNIDPDGAASIASNGGIIVDVTLEVRDYNVKVNHRYDGEIRETHYEYINAADASAWSPKRIMVPAGYAPTGGWPTFDIVDAGLNGGTLGIYYTYSDANMPFAFSTMGEDGNVTIAHYYTMTVHGKNAFFQPNSNGGAATNQIKLTATERTRDINDYFYFVGNNTEGFTVHSTAVSPALSFDVRDKKFTVAANKYRLLDTFDGVTHKYAVREAGSQAVMNDEGGGGNLGVWLQPSSVTHDYVLFTFAAAADATVTATIAAVPWPESGKYYYVKSGMTFETGTKALTVGDDNAPRWDTFNSDDLHFMWKATDTGGKYAFRNVNNNRYLKKIGETSEESANAYLIYMGLQTNGHQFQILSSIEQAIHANGHDNGGGNNGNIVAWYSGANTASTWVFEEVDDDAIRAGLATKVAEIEGKVGTGLGKYTLVDVDDYDDQMQNAKALSTDDTSELDNILDAIKALSVWTYELNMPQAGQFIRMQNVATPANYADNYVNSVTTTGASTIFYYTTDNGRKVLIGYDNGKCPKQNGNASEENETHLLAANTMEYTFAEASNNTGAGQYYVKWGDRYIFGKNAGGLDGGSGTNNDHGYNWTLLEVDALPVTITSAGYATFYTPVTVTVPEGVKAYVAEKRDTYLHLTEVSTISANQGVILKGEAGTYDFPIDGEGNGRDCALSGKIATAASERGDFVLSIGTIGGKANQVGMFPVNDGELLKGFKSYLSNGTAQHVAAFRFSFGEITTAIDAAGDDSLQEGVVYNLNGQRVQRAKGVIIVNGKKIVVK